MELSILIHTHSDNHDIWPICFDLIHKFFKKIPIYISTNNKSLFINTVTNIEKDNIYEYSETDTYPSRILQTIFNIKSEYTLLSRDTDWILNCEEEKIISLIPIMKQFNIDRLGLYHDMNIDMNCDYDKKNIINIDSNNYITKSRICYYAFSLMPSLWNLKSLFKLFSEFNNLNYQQLEHDLCQNYIKQYMNVYHLHSNLSIHKSWNANLVPYFEFIHVYNLDLDAAYGSFVSTFFELHKKYNIDPYKKLENRSSRIYK